jgi:hypothetical protein
MPQAFTEAWRMSARPGPDRPDEIEMARGADLEYERGAVATGGSPKDFAINGHLAHQIAGLIEVASEAQRRAGQ